jgi:hypothetical protein
VRAIVRQQDAAHQGWLEGLVLVAGGLVAGELVAGWSFCFLSFFFFFLSFF